MAFVVSIFGIYSQRRAVQTAVVSSGKLPDKLNNRRLLSESYCLRHDTELKANSVAHAKTEILDAQINISDVLSVKSLDDVDRSESSAAVYALDCSELKGSDIGLIVLAILSREKSRDPKRRFAILAYDEDEKNFLESLQQSKPLYQIDPTVFDNLESIEKTKKVSKASTWLIFSPASGLILHSVLIGICCLIACLDSTLLLQSVTGPALLVASLTICRLAILITGAISVGISFISDFPGKRTRANPNYTIITYFNERLLRLRNWHVDHPLQAACLYVGFVGSIIALTLILVLGIDAAWFEFIVNAVGNPGNWLGSTSSLNIEMALSAARVLVAATFILLPFSLGVFAKNSLVLHESRVTPNLDEDVSEVRLTEDKMGAEVRYHDHRQWYGLKLVAEKSPQVSTSQPDQPYTDVFFDGDYIKLRQGDSVIAFPKGSCGAYSH